ncbi:hypothetical protein ASD8599_00743 [Ascidiaceihabitans donghaensis]|uniref:Uncharacterized protein n=1 Tax=Ascidiaceihabitans donghaensis TaxID=1510460 RepID=A0A2R8BAG2_9RHOB|nr:hypothetical protein [Ascidiaceihabitans donghaensis]SPH20003.1 hypothetical protein ASD8599_00743 [Ascidiaceihabitans donghaensis]
MPLRYLAAAILALAPLNAGANGFYFDPGLTVNPVSATQFEVIEARGEGARGMWCAAARYAVYTLGQDKGRLYVDTPRGPSVTQNSGKGVVFTTQAPENPTQSVSVTVRRAGASLPVIHALQFCRDYDVFPDNNF